MPALLAAKLRYATYYFHTLEKADVLYNKGRDVAVDGLKMFLLEWENIQTAQHWVINASADHAMQPCYAAGFPR